MGLEGLTKEWYAINIVEDEEEQYSSGDKSDGFLATTTRLAGLEQ